MAECNMNSNGDLEIEIHRNKLQKCTPNIYIYEPEVILGKGCFGTKVYKGLIDINISSEIKNEVAVKRIRKDMIDMVKTERGILCKCKHDNIVRYHFIESDDNHWYMALELADMTLTDFVESENKFQFPTQIEILKQISEGLRYIHSLDIIHRDIKPTNILISLPLPPNNYRKIMIADFGISKYINSEHETSSLKGVDGFIAPEVIESKLMNTSPYQPSKYHDIHPLGCVFYYVLSNGNNPFGNAIFCRGNTVSGVYDVKAVLNDESVNKCHLIESMIIRDESKRPTIESIIKHPMFWDSERSLRFFTEVSNRIKKEKENSTILIKLESRVNDVIGSNWMKNIENGLKYDLKKHKYNGISIKDLIRAIRNKCQHCDDLPNSVKTTIGNTPIQILDYFMKQFPHLLIHTYVVLQYLKNEPQFESFYNSDPIIFGIFMSMQVTYPVLVTINPNVTRNNML